MTYTKQTFINACEKVKIETKSVEEAIELINNAKSLPECYEAMKHIIDEYNDVDKYRYLIIKYKDVALLLDTLTIKPTDDETINELIHKAQTNFNKFIKDKITMKTLNKYLTNV